MKPKEISRNKKHSEEIYTFITFVINPTMFFIKYSIEKSLVLNLPKHEDLMYMIMNLEFKKGDLIDKTDIYFFKY